MLSVEDAQNVCNNIHGQTIIRISDNMQDNNYPILASDYGVASGHNIRMEDSGFDIDAVRAAMREHGFTQTSLAKAIGLTSQSAMSNILKGKRGVSAKEAQQIYATLSLNTPLTSNIQLVPIIGLTSAGNWREAILMSNGQMALPNSIAGKRSFALEVSGDSMNLLIEDGGYIVIDPDKKALQDGKCYLIQNGDHEATVKCYHSNPSRFSPMSDNPEHKEFLVSDRDFIVMGRVIWKGTPL